MKIWYCYVVYIIARKYKSGVCKINVERNSFLNLIYANKFIRYSVPFMYHYDYGAGRDSADLRVSVY